MRKIAISLILMIFALVSAFAVEDNLTVRLTVANQTSVSFTKGIYGSTSSELNQDGFSIDEENSHYVPVVKSSDGSGSYKTDVFYASAKTNNADALKMDITYSELEDDKGNKIAITLSSGKCYINGEESSSPTNNLSAAESENKITLTEPSSNISGMRAISHELVVSVDKDKYEAALEGEYKTTLTLTAQLAEI